MPGAPAEETALIAALEAVTTDLAAEQFGKAMAALSTLRAPVDAFFDRVLVNADDAAVRENRLRLLPPSGPPWTGSPTSPRSPDKRPR